MPQKMFMLCFLLVSIKQTYAQIPVVKLEFSTFSSVDFHIKRESKIIFNQKASIVSDLVRHFQEDKKFLKETENEENIGAYISTLFVFTVEDNSMKINMKVKNNGFYFDSVILDFIEKYFPTYSFTNHKKKAKIGAYFCYRPSEKEFGIHIVEIRNKKFFTIYKYNIEVY